MAASNNTYKIDPLNGDNYTVWSRWLKWILDDLDLWDIMIGREMELLPVNANKITVIEQQEINNWRKRDKKAKKEICLRVADEQSVYINQTMTAFAVWTSLQVIFESKGAMGIINLWWDFFQTFAEDGANMEEHMQKLCRIQQELNTHGHYISNTKFANTLLTSLPDSCSAFITAVNASGIGPSADVLIAQVLDEDCTWKVGSAQQTVLKVQQHHKPKKDDSGATKGKCWNCGKKGHYIKDCWTKGGGQEGQAPKWFKPKETAKQAEEKDFAFMSKEVAYSAISASDWLADSAVTTHIARSRSDFTNYAEEPSKIKGISPSAVLHTWGWGSVHIEFKVSAKVNTIELCDVKHAPDALNNLISIGRLTNKGNSATFNGTGVEFKTQAGVIFAQGQKHKRLFCMKAWVTQSGKAWDFATTAKGRSWDKWHWILRHININSIKMLKTNNLVTRLDINETKEHSQCKACIQGKQHVEPFPKKAEDMVNQISDITVSDVWRLAVRATLASSGD